MSHYDFDDDPKKEGRVNYVAAIFVSVVLFAILAIFIMLLAGC